MSRCFPYPPPGYAGKCASNEALILSIKKGKEKPLSDKKKERKRDKKEKKEKVKANAPALNDLEKKKLQNNVNSFEGQNFGKRPEEGCLQSKLEAEHVEKSTVTEEHGKPCCSSDSTENSGQRKRPTLTTSQSNLGGGTVIRFLLSSQKREDPSRSPSTLPICSTSGRAEHISQKSEVNLNRSNRVVSVPAAPVKISASLPSNPVSIANVEPSLSKELSGHTDSAVRASQKSDWSNRVVLIPTVSVKSSTSQPLNPVSGPKVAKVESKEISKHTDSTSHDEKRKIPRPLRKYANLFDNWVPPLLEPMVNDGLDDDQSWLFSGRQDGSNPAKRLKTCKEMISPNCDGSSAMQPSAVHLTDIDIHALPFTVPF